jgi:hypothetical protein
MAAPLRASLDASLGLDGHIAAVDEVSLVLSPTFFPSPVDSPNDPRYLPSSHAQNVLVTRHGNGLRLLHMPDGRQSFIAPPVLGGVSAVGVSGYSK